MPSNTDYCVIYSNNFFKTFSTYKRKFIRILLLTKMNLTFENITPYFKKPTERTKSKYKTIMDPLSDKIQYLPIKE